LHDFMYSFIYLIIHCWIPDFMNSREFNFMNSREFFAYNELHIMKIHTECMRLNILKTCENPQLFPRDGAYNAAQGWELLNVYDI